jgi:hypothetical protein
MNSVSDPESATARPHDDFHGPLAALRYGNDCAKRKSARIPWYNKVRAARHWISKQESECEAPGFAVGQRSLGAILVASSETRVASTTFVGPGMRLGSGHSIRQISIEFGDREIRLTDRCEAFEQGE